MMNIHVRVTSTSAARQIRNLQREMMALNASTAMAGATAGRFGGPILHRGLRSLEKYGKNLQWVGRQIEFNFTLPLVLAGAAATKFAFEAEASFIRLEKVYQDAPDGIYTLQQELDLLRRGMRALSDEFGVHLDEVNEVGAAWAQAGASGVALAKATRMTLEAMILGDLEAAQATEALIAIQAQYELSSRDLQQALADVNKISNITTAGFQDLIEALQRGGGIARQAGVTIREFAAMTASLVPAAGNARRAGTALRTIISRVMAPTNQAKELFRELGLEIDDSSWHSSNFTDRLHLMNDALNDVTTSQRNVALSVIGSRWQVARLAVLFSDLNNETGRYNTALKGTEDQMKSMETYWEELEIFLTSTPQGFKILTNQIRNLSIDIIQQVLPALLGVLQRLRDVIKAFTELSPRVQQIVIGGLLMLAVLGTLTRLFGASVLVITQLAKAFAFAATATRVAFTMMSLFITGTTSSAILKRFGFLVTAITRVRSAVVLLALAPFRAVAMAFSGFLAVLSGRAFIGMIARGRGVIAAFAGAWYLLANGIRFAAAAVVLHVRAMVARIVGVFTMGLMPFLAKVGTAIVGFLIGPWGLVIAAVIGLIFAFQSQIANFVSNIADMWANIPRSLASAMRAAVDIVRAALEAIGRMFSSMFGGGAGGASIEVEARGRAQEFARGGGVGGTGNKDNVPALLTPGEFVINPKAVQKYGPEVFEQMNAMKFANGGQVPPALRDFLTATGGARAAMRAAELAEKREVVLSFAPGAGSEFDALVASISHFQRRAEQVSFAITAQEQVVNRWSAALDQANLRLDAASDHLSLLQQRANAVQTELNAAQDYLSELANTPIEGTKAFSDALFENEMAQKRLRLEMLRMEEGGESIDDVRDRLAKLSGEIEMLRGRREDLRLAGAGSEILSTFDTEIKALESQRKALMSGGGAGGDSGIADLQKQMEDLQRQAEMMRLEESIKFDPLRREIDEVTNSMEEMPFGELIRKIKQQQNEVDRLTARHDAATAAVERQQVMVDRLTAARDAVQRSYDSEKAKLDALKDTYSIITDQIRQMESALNDFVASAQAAQAAADAASESGGIAEEFRNAAGEFEIPGGTGSVAFEEGDLQELVEGWEEELTQSLGSFDLFKPLRDLWHKALAWVRERWQMFLDWLGGLGIDFSGIGSSLAEAGSSIMDTVRGWWDAVQDSEIWKMGDRIQGIFEAIVGFAVWVGDALSPIIREVVDLVGGFFSDLGSGIFDELGNWGPTIERIFAFVVTVFETLMATLGAIIGAVVAVIVAVWPTIRDVMKPIFDFIAAAVRIVIQILRGLINFVIGVLTGDWKAAWEGILTIVDGVWDAIFEIFRVIRGVLWGLVKGLVEGIVDFWVWLLDGIGIPATEIKNFLLGIWQSILADAGAVWDKVWGVIQWVWENGIKVVWAALKFYWERILKPVILTIAKIFSAVFKGVASIVKWVWNTVIKVVWAAIKFYWQRVLRPAINNIKSVFQSVFRGIGIIVRAIWNNVIKPVWTAIKWYWDRQLKPAINNIKSVFQSVFRGIGSVIGVIWRNVIRPIFNGFKEAVKSLPRAFRTARDGIGRIWEGIKGIIGRPVRWLARNVVNKLIGAFNSIARRVPGLPTLPLMVVPQFHEGGVVGEGGTPRDLTRHPLRRDESVAVLRNGERVLTEDERRWYEQNDPNAIRHVGGPSDWVKDAASAVGGAVTSAGRAALDTIRNVIANVARPVVTRALGALDRLPIGGWIGRALKGNVRNMAGKLLDWIDSADDKAKELTPDFLNNLVQVGRRMQGMGYHVAEHPSFGGVAPVHSPNSYHYRGQAIDVNYYPRSSESRKLDQLEDWIRSNVNPNLIAELLWRTTGHWSHLHLAMHGSASGYYGPGGGSPSRGDVANVGAGTGGLVMDNGGVFTRPTTGIFSMAQSSMARPEVVSPVPLMRKVMRSELQNLSVEGKTEIHFHGDLEFPNVSDGSDAEDFIANIKSLSRSN